MSDNDPFGRSFNRRGGQPWFGPRRFGFGYRPQTWQGYLLVALCVLVIAIVAAITGGHSPLMVFAVIPFAIVAAVARVQGRR